MICGIVSMRTNEFNGVMFQGRPVTNSDFADVFNYYLKSVSDVVTPLHVSNPLTDDSSSIDVDIS